MSKHIRSTPVKPRCRARRRIVIAMLGGVLSLLSACSSTGQAISTVSTAPDPGPATTRAATSPGIGLPENQNTPKSEVELMASMEGAIQQLDWPTKHELSAKALWTSKLAPAAQDTALGEIDAVQLVEAWNMCAWVLEVTEAVEAHDQQRLRAAAKVLATLDSRFRYTSSGGSLAEVAAEAKSGSKSLAGSFVAANDCENWPA